MRDVLGHVTGMITRSDTTMALRVPRPQAPVRHCPLRELDRLPRNARESFVRGLIRRPATAGFCQSSRTISRALPRHSSIGTAADRRQQGRASFPAAPGTPGEARPIRPDKLAGPLGMPLVYYKHFTESSG